MEQIVEYETPQNYLKRLLKHDDSDDFRIIIDLTQNNQKENSKGRQQEKKYIFNTTMNKARVVSRKIDEAYQVDPTISEYSVNIPKETIPKMENVSHEAVEEILQTLIKSTIAPVQIKKSQQDSYSIITAILNGQSDRKSELKYEIKNEDEAISLLSTEFHYQSIEYLSGHIIEFITKTDLRNIEEGIINDIIDAFISGRHEGDKEGGENDAIQIFEILKSKEEPKIAMRFLLSLDIEEYNDDMIEYIYGHLDDEVIESEASRVIFTLRCHFLKILESCRGKNKNKNKGREIKECEYNGNQLSGIIDYLQRQNGTDLEAKNILKLSGGGFPHSSWPITNLIKYNSNYINNEYYFNYHSRNPGASDGWIEFDFGNRTVNLTSYTIRNWTGDYKPKSWRIVGSNDHEEWDVVDHRVNNSELKSHGVQHRFENTKTDNYYRYIRYIQEEVWDRDSIYNSCIVLTRIEFFGSISSPKSQI